MERNDVKKYLWEQLEKLPERKMFQFVTESQLEVIAAELIDPEPVEKFLEDNCLCITLDELPPNISLFKIVLFFILNRGDAGYYLEEVIWELEDDKTEDALEEMKINIDAHEQSAQMDITATKLSDFLRYAKSQA